MGRPWLVCFLVLFAGCGQAPQTEPPSEPEKTTTDLARLTSALNGIRNARSVALFEGLPSEFWEPQVREQELSQKKTIALHGYRFYEERLAVPKPDAERFTALFLARGSFLGYRSDKACGGYHPDYCIEWTSGQAVTHGLVCLECGEVKLYGSGAALYCDLSPRAASGVKQLLTGYQKNRPPPQSKG